MLEKYNCWRPWCDFFDPSEWDYWTSYSRKGLEEKLIGMEKGIENIKTLLK